MTKNRGIEKVRTVTAELTKRAKTKATTGVEKIKRKS